MSNKKANPRRVPKTEADVEQARYEGRVQGAQLMLTCLIWLLCDKHEAPAEDVKQFSQEVQYLLENISARNVSYPLIKKTLKEEHGWQVNFYVGENIK